MLVSFKISQGSLCLSCATSALGCCASQMMCLIESFVADQVEILPWVMVLVWLWIYYGLMRWPCQGSSESLCPSNNKRLSVFSVLISL